MSLRSTPPAFPQSLNPQHSSMSFIGPCRLSVLSQPLVFKNFSFPSVIVLDARRHHLVSARLLVLYQSSLFKVCLTTPQSLSPIGDTCWHCLVGPHSSAPFQSSHLCYLTLCSSMLLSLVVHVVPSLPHQQYRGPRSSASFQSSLFNAVLFLACQHCHHWWGPCGQWWFGQCCPIKVSIIIVIVSCQYDNISLKSHWKSMVMQI